MYREARLVLAVVVLVVLPTAILSLIAARNLKAWQLLQEKRLEAAGAAAVKDLESEVEARLAAIHDELLAAVGPAPVARPDPGAWVRMLAPFRSRHPEVAGVCVYDAALGHLVYPPPLSAHPEASARSRWVQILSSGPDVAVLEEARRLRMQSGDWDHANQEFQRILEKSGLHAEVWCEAAMELSHCLRERDRAQAAAEILLRLIRFSGGREAAGDVIRDEDGCSYHLLAMQTLGDLYRRAGATVQALDAEIALMEAAVGAYDGLPSLQRSVVSAHVFAEVPALLLPQPDGLRSERQRKAAQLLSELQEWNRALDLAPSERATLEQAMTISLRGAEGSAGLRRWIPYGGLACLAGRLPESDRYWTGFWMDSNGWLRCVSSAADQIGRHRGLLLQVEPVPSATVSPEGRSDGRLERLLARDTLRWPFGSARISVFAAGLDAGGDAGLFIRLSTWGVFLLGMGILAGSWLALRRAGQEIRKAAVRTDFTAGISHELRTPVSAMRMLTESLYYGHVHEADTQKKFLETILNETDRLWRLIERLLFFIRMGEGEVSFEFRVQDIRPLIQDTVQAFHDRLGQGSARVALSLPSDPVPVRLDSTAIEQVLLNLLDNAAKYSRGQPQIDVTVTTDLRAHRLSISVTDRGIGIDPRVQKKIFRKFYRVRSAETAGVPGVGLGLSLCLHVVRAHHGKITVRSAPGQGSTFTVVLPLAQAVDDESER